LDGSNLHKEAIIAGFKCRFFKELDSTNSYARENMSDLINVLPAVILADSQQEGRGQNENTWDSEPEKNLLLSVVIKPGFSVQEGLFRINYLLTFSIIDTIKRLFGVEAHLKWPNDVFVNDKKVAGVLAETSIQGDKINILIGGVGININQSFDSVGAYKAISLADVLGKEVDKDLVLKTFLATLKEISEKTAYSSLNFLEEKSSKILWKRGKEQKFYDKETGKTILAFPDKFCSDHSLLVRHNGINKKLRHESFQWIP
jgi:BirA family biotin operon repressor/biotin-[acetyl-CoA-carboxylase] ligase